MLIMTVKVQEAVQNAVAYTHHGIETAYPMGAGHGPLNHFHSMSPRSIPRYVVWAMFFYRYLLISNVRPTDNNRQPFTRKLIQGNAGEWKEYVEHDFVKLLGQGTLPRGPFVHFIKLVDCLCILWRVTQKLRALPGKITSTSSTTLVHMRKLHSPREACD